MTAFISDASNFTLGDGVYTNVQGNIVHHHHNFYGTKRRRHEIEDKRPRLEEEGATSGLKIVRQQNLHLIQEIGSGPGYRLHAARNKARVVTAKVFNSSDPNARQQLESAVALCKKLMHPNVLRMKGISSSTSLSQFIVYEDVARKNAKGPLATALKDRTRSVQLGFKMVADLSAGMDYLSEQVTSLAVMRAENFDVFLDVEDRFLIIIDANSCDKTDTPNSHGSQEDHSWALFNGLCDKVFLSANRVLHTEEIDRDPVSSLPTSVAPQESDSSSLSIGSSSSQDQQEDVAASSVGDPRREYVWRAMDRGQQSLATVTDHLTTHLDIALTRLRKLTRTGRSAHRCRGYMREEITLAPTIMDSAVVAHDTPRLLEICFVCHESIAVDEQFRCVCGDYDPGSRYTVKCTVCKFWSHSDCVGDVETDLICETCRLLAHRVGLDDLNSERDFAQRFNSDEDEGSILMAVSDTSTTRHVVLDGGVFSDAVSFEVQDHQEIRQEASTSSGRLDEVAGNYHNPRSYSDATMSQPQPPPPPRGPNRTKLNNIAQRRGVVVEYSDSQTGPLTASQWTTVVYLNRYEYGRGTGSTKESARERAATHALALLLIAQGY